jgi:serine/threonine-protein kinase
VEERGTSPGTLVDGRFLLRRQIGGGGAAIVWLGEDLQSQTSIAVKLLHPKLRAVDSVLSRLTLEAQLLSSLDHPHIARAVAFGFDRVQPFIALEYIEGSTLQAEIGARSPMDDHFEVDMLMRLFGQLCSAVDHAHERGIVHRDLKPANVMLQATQKGATVKVLDFGIAKMIDQHPSAATTQGRMLGSVAFMSPEQARGDPVDHRTDVYALGVILQEMLTLRRVWALGDDGGPIRAYAEPMRLKGPNTPQAMFERIGQGRRPSPSSLRPALGAEVDRLIDRALAGKPEDRFPTAGALRNEAERILIGEEETLDPTFVRDPTKLYTELRTLAFQPADPAVAPVESSEVTAPNPNAAMFTPTPLVPTPHGMIVPQGQRNLLSTLLFGGGLAIGVLATMIVMRSGRGPESGAGAETQIAPTPLPIRSEPAAASPRAVADTTAAANPPEPVPSEDPPSETEPVRSPPRRAGTTQATPTAPNEAPTEAAKPSVPWGQLESLLSKGSSDPEKLDELSKRILELSKDVHDETARKKIHRLLSTNLGNPEVLAGALKELRKALE